jgi:hypothetical protein
MDTVYHRDSLTISAPGAGPKWLKFSLDHPFVYDNNKSLVIKLEQYGFTPPGTASSIQPHTFLTGNRRNYCTIPPFYLHAQDAYAVHFGIDMTVTGVEPSVNPQVPKEYNLRQNYPNPFNPNTTIKFDLPKSTYAKLIIYDMLGREVMKLIDEKMDAGSYDITWDGSNFASGTYIYKLVTEDYTDIKKMILIK